MSALIHSEWTQQIQQEISAQRHQIARLSSRYLSIASGLVALLMFGVWLTMPEYVQLLVFALGLTVMSTGNALYGLLAHRRSMGLGIAVSLATFMVAIFSAAVAMAELLPAIAIAYQIVVVMGSRLLNKRPRLLLTSLCVLFLVINLLMLHATDSWFPALDSTLGLILGAIVAFVAMIVNVLVVWVLVTSQEQQFKSARMGQFEVDRMAASERAQKDRLETAVTEYTLFVQKVASGDLTSRLNVDTVSPAEIDDLYKLGVHLNVMVESLHQMAQQIRGAAAAVLSASLEIQAAASQQVASATEQNAAVTHTVATVEEVEVTVAQTAERAQNVADAALSSRDVSYSGQSAINDTISGMLAIQERVERIAETILNLSDHSQHIGEIISTVSALADQSKLLALNASIEAARAGEEGRGFAIVAMEVRNLAEQSRDATAHVQAILNEIQHATNNAVMVTEEGSKSATSGMALVERAGEAIQALTVTLEEAAQAAIQIAASTQQQTTGMHQLSAAMVEIRQASLQAAASTQQTEQSVENIISTAHQLEQAAARYRLQA